MKPPITVNVWTDNLHNCELRISGADGVAHAIRIPSDGNVYQGLHRARAGLETYLNGLLEAHGIKPDVVDEVLEALVPDESAPDQTTAETTAVPAEVPAVPVAGS